MSMEFENEQMEEVFDTEETQQSEMPRQPKQPKVQKPQKVRRVGTFTMGCVMILAGIALVATIVSQNWNMALLMFKFSPLVWVALGVEVLVASFSSGVKLKYDVLSVFICGFLVLVVSGAALIPQLFLEYGPQRAGLESKISKEVYQTIYEKIGTEGIDNLYVNCYVNGMNFPKSESELKEDIRTHLDFRLNREYSDVQKMAEKVNQINQSIGEIFGLENATGIEARYSVMTDEHKEQSVVISGLYGLDLSKETIQQQIQNSLYQYDRQDELDVLNAQMQEERQSYEDRIAELQKQLEDTVDEMNQQAQQQRTEYENQIAELQNQLQNVA